MNNSLSSMHAAHRMEGVIRRYLFKTAEMAGGSSAHFASVRMVDLYALIQAHDFGITMTAQFFNRVVADMKRAGIVSTPRGGEFVVITTSAYLQDAQKESAKAGV